LSNFVFEVNDASGSSSDMSGSVIKNYQITVNRFHSSQTSTSSDIVTSKYLTANLDGTLPKTQVAINTTGVTDMNAYFDACFSIVVTPFNAAQVSQDSLVQSVITKYVLPPTASDFGPVSITSEQSRIIIDASLTDASFNPTGLQYLIQIDGVNSSNEYLSRNEYVAVDGSNHLFFDTSGTTGYGENGGKRLVNTKFYDVTVIALNTTGSVTLKNETIRVDENANPPVLSITENQDEYNFASSEGKIVLSIVGRDITNDPDQEYKLTVAQFDTSNVPLLGYPKTIVAGISGENFHQDVDVSYLITGLTANTKYVLTATAKNSTPTHSLSTSGLQVTPEALPSGLKITEIRRGLNASETDPSGRLLVFLDSATFLPNGIDVSLNYKIKSFTDSEAVTMTADVKLKKLLTEEDESAAIIFKEAFYDLSNNLVASGTAFDISGLTNNKHQLVAVFAENKGTLASDLSASWVGVGVSSNTLGSGDNAVILNTTNAPKPITHPDAPSITGTHPVEFEKSNLASGEISVTIKLPVNNYEYDSSASDGVNNIPDYASYKIMIEDMSGSDISNIVVTLDPSYDYLETGKLFKYSSTGSASNIDGSSVIVSDSSDGLIGLYQKTTANKPSTHTAAGSFSDVYSGYQLDPSWVEFGRVTWVDVSGANRMRDDASFTAVFPGLINGKRYRAKAQVTLDSMESSIIDLQDKIVPSKKPELISSVSSLIPGIFDVSAGTILDPNDNNNTSYDASGIELIIAGADNGGYDISGIAVVFVFQYTTNGNTVNRVDKIFNVGIDGGKSDLSGVITNDEETLVGTTLSSQNLDTSELYNVFVVPQNAVYYDGVSFESFLDISNLAGTIMLTGLELDSAILDISSIAFNIDPLDSTKIKVTGQIQVAVNGEYTVLKRLDGSLTRKGKAWNATSEALEDATDASDVVVSFTIAASELDASSNFSTEFTTTATHYGWDHTVEIAAISRPKGDATSSVEYKQTPKNNTVPLVPGKRPTVILDPTVDASNKQVVEVLPNGSTTVVTLIDLSGNALATIDPIPGGSTGNDVGAMNTIVNTFYNASGILVSLDSTVDGGELPATGSDVSGLYNTFKIDASLNLQASAHNAHGRTTLFSEKTFELVVVSGSASVVADASNDGLYTLSVGGNTVQLKLDLKENDYGNA
jgi:hypothetical protein